MLQRWGNAVKFQKTVDKGYKEILDQDRGSTKMQNRLEFNIMNT